MSIAYIMGNVENISEKKISEKGFIMSESSGNDEDAEMDILACNCDYLSAGQSSVG